MATYTVHLISTVSTAVTVEADDPQTAIDAAYESRDMPDGITYGAFGNRANVDHSGEWNAVEVAEEDGGTVWAEHPATVSEQQWREAQDELRELRAQVERLTADRAALTAVIDGRTR